MAIGYMRMSVCKATPQRLADYIQRQGKYATGSKAEELVYCETMNLPSWAKDAHDFWAECDKRENGKNATKARYLEIALPNELNTGDEIKLVCEYAQKQFPGHVVTIAIHHNIGALSGKDNDHAHLEICEREIDKTRPEPDRETYFKKSRTRKDGSVSGGYRKSPEMSKKGYVSVCKESYAKLANRALQNAHSPAKVVFKSKDGKSIHLGAKTIARAIKTGRTTGKMQDWIDRRTATAMHTEAKKEWDIAERYTRVDTSWTGVLKETGREIRALIKHPLNKELRRRALIGMRIAAERHPHMTAIYTPMRYVPSLGMSVPDEAHAVKRPTRSVKINEARTELQKSVKAMQDSMTCNLLCKADRAGMPWAPAPEYRTKLKLPAPVDWSQSPDVIRAQKRTDAAYGAGSWDYITRRREQEQERKAQEQSRKPERKPERKAQEQSRKLERKPERLKQERAPRIQRPARGISRSRSRGGRSR